MKENRTSRSLRAAPSYQPYAIRINSLTFSQREQPLELITLETAFHTFCGAIELERDVTALATYYVSESSSGIAVLESLSFVHSAVVWPGWVVTRDHLGLKGVSPSSSSGVACRESMMAICSADTTSPIACRAMLLTATRSGLSAASISVRTSAEDLRAQLKDGRS